MKKILFAVLAFYSIISANESNENILNIGENIYKKTCAYCHGNNGIPPKNITLLVVPRDLRKSILEEEQIFRTIKYGAHFWGAKSDIMPSFKSVFSDSEIKAVTQYVSKKLNPDRKDKNQKLYEKSQNINNFKNSEIVNNGKKLFNKNCKLCHGAKGRGDGIATKKQGESIYPYDLTKILLTEEQIFLYVKYGGKYFGTFKNDMRSWQNTYNDDALKSVAKYVYQILNKADK